MKTKRKSEATRTRSIFISFVVDEYVYTLKKARANSVPLLEMRSMER